MAFTSELRQQDRRVETLTQQLAETQRATTDQRAHMSLMADDLQRAAAQRASEMQQQVRGEGRDGARRGVAED